MRITSSKKAKPRRTVLYGVHGIGKSTWASKWPNPVFIPTEDGISDLDVQAFPLCRTLEQAWGPLIELTSPNESHDFKTVVIDSADWLEKLIWKSVCEKHHKETISDFGYGKGYAEAANKMEKYLQTLNECRERGMHVLILAHAAITRFESPESDSYDRYSPKLHRDCAALLQEWADEVLFANYKTYTRKTNEGFGRERAIATGSGERVIYTTELPSHNAKNRLGLPEQMPLDFEAYSEFLPKIYDKYKNLKADGKAKKADKTEVDSVV